MIRWIVCVLVGLVSVLPVAAETPAAKIESFGRTPLIFEPNLGQTDASVRFLSRGDRYGLFLTDTEAIVSLAGPTPAIVHMKMVGQNPHPQISGSGSQPGTSQYVKGSAPSKWQESVPHFLKVDYRQVYPGVDLTYYGNQRQLEYDFTVAPHANPKSIELQFSGVDRIAIGDSGDLILSTAAGEIRHQHPRVYQERNGIEEAIEGQFALLGSGKVGFRIGKYDRNLPLVIDPKFVYSTYFGGAGANGDLGIDVKVDSFGVAYVTGYTSSLDFFSTNLSTTSGGGNLDAFILKVNATGSTILSAMYFGGSGDDEGHRIALDGSGNIYITGYTTSTDFPIVNGFQTKLGGRKDAYIAKINNAASQILFSSYLGGTLDDQPYGLSVDPAGNIYIAGETLSANFPLVRPIRSNLQQAAATDGFVTKLAPSGAVIYSTFLGGQGSDRAFDVTSDADGDAIVVGFTTSVNFPVVQAVYPTFQGGSEDAFVTKLSPDGSAYLLSTFLGGAGTDEAVRVVLDSNQDIIVSGYTSSPNFPSANAIQTDLAGAFDIFVTKLVPDGSTAVFSTYIGSDGTESAPGLALDPSGNIYIAGFTSSFSFPVVNGINIGTTGGFLHGNRDAYIMKLSPEGRIFFSTYIGGSDSDGVVGLAVDAGGTAYLTGYSFSQDFPVQNAFQTQASNVASGVYESDGILLKISSDDVVVSSPLAVPSKGVVTLSTVGASNAVNFAHATFEVPVGAKLPAGMAILDLRQGGAEVGEVALPLLPFIKQGRIYIDESSIQSTNLSIVNPSSDEITFEYAMTDRNGDVSNGGGFTIPAKSSFAQPVTGPPFLLPAGSSGTLSFAASAPVAAIAFRTFSETSGTILVSYLPIVDGNNYETRTTTIPQFASDLTWQSQFILVNNTDVRMSGQVQFYNNGPDEGDPTQSSTPIELNLDRGSFSSVPYDLAARGSDSFVTVGSETTVSGYAQIVPDPGTFTPVGSVIFAYTRGSSVTLRATEEAQIPTNDQRMFVERSGDFDNGEGHATAMAFALSNPSSLPTTVTITLVNMDGTPTGFSTAFTLPAQGHIATYLHRMAAFANMPNPFTGIALVHASGPGVVLFGMRGRMSENNAFVGSTTSPIKENVNTGTFVIFPHVLDGGGYATEFILFSDPLGPGTTGTINFANENGVALPLNLE